MQKNTTGSHKNKTAEKKNANEKNDVMSLQEKLFPNGWKELWQGDSLRFIIGFLCFLIAILMLLAFSSHIVTGFEEQADLEAGQLHSSQNYVGIIGAYVSNYFMDKCFGLCAYFVPVFIIALSIKFMRVYKVRLWKWFINCGLLMVWGSTTLSLIQHTFLGNAPIGRETFALGGQHGANALHILTTYTGTAGTYMIIIAIAICYMVYLSSETIDVIRRIMKPQDYIRAHFHSRKMINQNENAEVSVNTVTALSTSSLEASDHNEDTAPSPHDESSVSLDLSHNEGDGKEPALIFNNVDTQEGLSVVSDPTKLTINQQIEEEKAHGKTIGESIADLEPYDPRKDLVGYQFPPLKLLKQYADNGPAVDMAEQNANKDRIITVLKSFGVDISSIKATIGPTITLYEITPAQGVRINKIRGLEDDIALSLSALGIRIIAPIPGKGTIGIEVPNKKPRIVSMESILNSRKFQECTFELPVALGKTITNEVFTVDLAKMPHLLVAGATGQGKSVGLNAIITSLLYKKHPSELKIVMVDPKKVEFSIYSPIENHFLAKIPDGNDPIITDVTKVVQTLKSLCQLMDNRYDLLKKAKVRNIKEYNAKFKERKLNPENGHAFMPYIVVIIDEFGDLIMTAGKEVELPIARIAQLARAVGMHMVIATQRPTTNIITGTIKANFPARMAFKVMSRIDSQTILDRTGANQLVGKGDMLFLAGNDPIRVQCAFVDTPEVEQINAHIAAQPGYPAAYELPEVLPDGENGGGNDDLDTGNLDPLFEQAARLIVIHQQGSTSLIQRKFSIGYNRAGRLMDQLEKAGIVGPTRGAKPREVLCTDEMELDVKLTQL